MTDPTSFGQKNFDQVQPTDQIPADPPIDPRILRVLDANANRATEGLRVVEEFLRFCIEDRSLSQRCKQIRHEVSKTVSDLSPNAPLIACRSTTTDVGVQNAGEREYQRSSDHDIVFSNLKRAEEALRVLEEYAKRLSVAAAKTFELQRYELYTLEKSLFHLLRATHSLATTQLYVLVDEHYGLGDTFQQRIEALLAADSHRGPGVDAIQLRAKSVTDRQLAETSRWLAQACRKRNVLFIVNDRPDIARAVGAHGVHVGQDELSVADTRAVVGPEALVGVSTHTPEQAQQAVRDGADYIGVGPVYASETKSFEELAGRELVTSVADQIKLPFFPIGGINSANLADLVAAGADRVAVSHAIWRAEDVGSAVAELRAILPDLADSRSLPQGE